MSAGHEIKVSKAKKEKFLKCGLIIWSNLHMFLGSDLRKCKFMKVNLAVVNLPKK